MDKSCLKAFTCSMNLLTYILIWWLYSSVLCELLLLRSILRSDIDTDYFDTRLKQFCDQSLRLLNKLTGLYEYDDLARNRLFWFLSIWYILFELLMIIFHWKVCIPQASKILPNTTEVCQNMEENRFRKTWTNVWQPKLVIWG